MRVLPLVWDKRIIQLRRDACRRIHSDLQGCFRHSRQLLPDNHDKNLFSLCLNHDNNHPKHNNQHVNYDDKNNHNNPGNHNNNFSAFFAKPASLYEIRRNLRRNSR